MGPFEKALVSKIFFFLVDKKFLYITVRGDESTKKYFSKSVEKKHFFVFSYSS
jgi:hypothetical protein